VLANRFKASLVTILLLASSVCSDTSFVTTSTQKKEITRANLIAAAKAGGDYLIRMQKSDGSFHYFYHPAKDLVEPRTYNIVRHAGTILSIFELYENTRDTRYLDCARRAMVFLKTRFRPGRSRSAEYVLDFDGKAKLGAIGLSLAALAEQLRLDSRFADPKSAARLANMILSMQRKNGSFEMRYRLQGSDDDGFESLYYPGEALLGLIRFFKQRGDRKLLDAAIRGIEFLIESQQKMARLPADAWLIQAIDDFYGSSPRKKFAEHAIAIAEAMIAEQYDESDERAEYAGGFGPGPPRSTPAASRAEGLVAAYRLARSISDSRASRIARSLKACARFQLAQQFTPANSGSLANSARAMGGFRESLTSVKIRIDFVQDNISSLLGIGETVY
jgi:hypothetical protein